MALVAEDFQCTVIRKNGESRFRDFSNTDSIGAKREIVCVADCFLREGGILLVEGYRNLLLLPKLAG